MSDLTELRESYQQVLTTTPVSLPKRVAVMAYVEGLEAALLDLLRLHDAQVFVKEPWDTAFDEVRAALAAEGKGGAT